MKKIVLIVTFGLFAILGASDIDKYLSYSNQLLNYQFELKDFNKITAPFELEVKVVNGKKVKTVKTLIKTIKVDLLSIFDNRAYVLIKEYLGDQLVKKYRKWIKVSEKIGSCKVSKVTFDKLILKCKDRVLTKTLYKKIPNIKEKQ